VLLLLLAGCDPGMSIRQAVQRDSTRISPGMVNRGSLAIHVKTSHVMIGETWYSPEITATNTFDSPVSVSAVELVVKGSTYSTEARRTGLSPVVVPSGQTETLDISFTLHHDVKTTFYKQSGELRVHYQRDGVEEIAQSRIIGGPLDTPAQ